MPSDAQTVKDAYEAFGRGDLPTVMATFADDIEWITPDSTPFGGTVHGKEGVASFFAALSRHWSELHVEPERFVESGDTVIALGRIRATAAQGSGHAEFPFAHVFEMRDGKTIRFQEYIDTARANEALGVTLARH